MYHSFLIHSSADAALLNFKLQCFFKNDYYFLSGDDV